MSQTLVDDQAVLLQPNYLVCAGGDYNDLDLVQVYRDDDPDKTPWVAFTALYVATGLNEVPPT